MTWRRLGSLLLLLLLAYVIVVLGPILLALLIAWPGQQSRHPLVLIGLGALALRFALRGLRGGGTATTLPAS